MGAGLLNQNWLRQSQLIQVCAADSNKQLQMSRRNGANVTQISTDNWHFCVGLFRAGTRFCFSCMSQNTQRLNDGALRHAASSVSIYLAYVYVALFESHMYQHFGGQ